MFFQCLDQNFLFDVLQTDTLFGQFEADVCNSRPVLPDVRWQVLESDDIFLAQRKKVPTTSPSISR